jgi:glutathione S-transferase
LEAAGANYKMEEVSLYGPGGKPDWFWKLNPKGEVPVLVVDSNVIFADSDLILDEIGMVMANDGSSMLVVPGNNSQELDNKAKAFRSCLREFLPIGKKSVLGGDKKKMWDKLQELDALIEGPYVAGEELTVADCSGFPFLWRIDQEFGGWDDHGCTKIPLWLKHCSKQPAFASSVQRSWWWWW